MRIIEYNGVRKSVTAWARELGISKMALYTRLNNGLPIDKVLTRGRRPSGRPKGSANWGMPNSTIFIEHDGIRDTLDGWAKRLGIGKNTLYTRYRRLKGKDVSCIFTKNTSPVRVCRGIIVEYKGKVRTLREWAKVLKRTYKHLLHLYRSGKSMDEIMKPRATLYKYRGQTHTLKEWSRILGIKHVTLRMRLRSGWSVEHAFDARNFVTERTKFYEYNGRKMTLREIVDETGMRMRTVRQRLGRGMSIADAVRKVDYHDEARRRCEKKYTHDGKTMSLREWENATGIKRTTLVERIKNGMDFGTAITKKIRTACTVEYKGEVMPLRKVSELTGIPMVRLQSRLKNGIKPPRLFAEGKLRKDCGRKLVRETEIEYRGEKRTLEEWAKHFGVNMDVVYCRYRHHVPVEFLFEKRHLRNTKGKIGVFKQMMCVYEGKRMTLSEAAKASGIPYYSLVSRIKAKVPQELLFTKERMNTHWKDLTSGRFMVEFNGKMMPLAEVAPIVGVRAQTLRNRYSRGVRPPELFKKGKVI